MPASQRMPSSPLGVQSSPMPFNPFKYAMWGGLVLVALIIFLGTYFTVGQNERVVVSSWGEFRYVADPGLHFKIPFRDSTYAFSSEIQSADNRSENQGKGANTYTEDNQEVDVVYTVFYRIPTDTKSIEYLYSYNRDYPARLRSMVVDRIKAAMGNVNVQLLASKRGELRDTIKATLEHDAKTLGITVTDFQLTSLQYTDSYRNAVNGAAVQKAQVEQREYARQEAVKEAERVKAQAIGVADAAREEARGHADATLLNAKADAEKIRLMGEAQANAMQAQAEALKTNPALVEMEKATRWNGQLPSAIYAGAPIPFMSTPAGK